ncbi:TVP38/TMEM64 family protein [Patescibacteria group bacterium]|nr:TVP38/TMEM64 family protein [Patescibacteria group bacterium]
MLNKSGQIMHGAVKVLLALLVLVAVVVVLRVSGVTDGITTESVRGFIAGYGPLAPLVFIVVYAVATIAVVPGSVLTVTSGALFGPLLGTICAVTGAVIGASISFLFVMIVRGGRPLSGEGPLSARLIRYDERMASHGFITVLFLRLVPVFPFTVLNYSLGLTRVKARDYVFGTALGIIPGSFAYTYFGDALSMVQTAEIVLAVLGIIALTALGHYLSKRYG